MLVRGELRNEMLNLRMRQRVYNWLRLGRLRTLLAQDTSRLFLVRARAEGDITLGRRVLMAPLGETGDFLSRAHKRCLLGGRVRGLRAGMSRF